MRTKDGIKVSDRDFHYFFRRSHFGCCLSKHHKGYAHPEAVDNKNLRCFDCYFWNKHKKKNRKKGIKPEGKV